MNESFYQQNELLLYSRRDVCRMLKISISFLDKIPESDLPRVHLGKSIRYRKQSLINYIEKKEVNYESK